MRSLSQARSGPCYLTIAVTGWLALRHFSYIASDIVYSSARLTLMLYNCSAQAAWVRCTWDALSSLGSLHSLMHLIIKATPALLVQVWPRSARLMFRKLWLPWYLCQPKEKVGRGGDQIRCDRSFRLGALCVCSSAANLQLSLELRFCDNLLDIHFLGPNKNVFCHGRELFTPTSTPACFCPTGSLLITCSRPNQLVGEKGGKIQAAGSS